MKKPEEFKRKYSPVNITECFQILDKELSEDAKNKYKNKDSFYAILQHFGTGMWIRNQFGLWDETSPLYKYFSEKLFYFHSDDISSLILSAYSRYLNNEIENFENCIFTHSNVYKDLDEYYLSEINNQKEFVKISKKVNKNYKKESETYHIKLYKYKNNKFLLRTSFRNDDLVVIRKENKEFEDIKNVKRDKKDWKWESYIDNTGMKENNKYYRLKSEGLTWEESFDNLIIKIKEA
jgi:hypothetical protein